jgi:hypothetical protein
MDGETKPDKINQDKQSMDGATKPDKNNQDR